jgi:hypothetical protein
LGLAPNHFLAVKEGLIPRDAIIVEEGAGCGAHTLELSRQYDQGQIHAFEADPAHAEFLDILTLTSHNVSVYPYGLSDRLRPAYAGPGGITMVPLDYVAGGWPRLDLIIIRSQHKKDAILKGAEDTIKRLHPTIILQ